MGISLSCIRNFCINANSNLTRCGITVTGYLSDVSAVDNGILTASERVKLSSGLHQRRRSHAHHIRTPHAR